MSEAVSLRSPLTAAEGILLLDKPSGVSSFQALRPVKKAFPKTKIGHAGTLDPAATGLLLIGIGTATRLLEFLEGMTKTYSFTAYFGATSESYDCESPLTYTSLTESQKENVNTSAIQKALENFRGKLQQIPPTYSAIKIQGKRAADRVRSGETVTMIAREVELFRFELKSFTSWREVTLPPIDSPAQSTLQSILDSSQQLHSTQALSSPQALASADFEITCSKGTYVRSLVHDLGQHLGCGAVTDQIRRLAIGVFKTDDACTLENFAANPNPEQYLKPLNEAVALLPTATLTEKGVTDFLQGRFLNSENFHLSQDDFSAENSESLHTNIIKTESIKAVDKMGRLIAIASLNGLGLLCPKKVLIQK